MTDTPHSDSPLEAAAGAAGPHIIEAFSILGNKTRLSILLGLWEAYEPFAETNAMSFTELRDRIGVQQGGRFNYHLDKLVGEFVRKTDDGYELRRAGLRLVRTVIAGVGFETRSLEPTEIDDPCTLCGAPTAISYQDELLYHVCTHCDGYFGSDDARPDGMLAAYELDPAGLSERRPEAIVHTAVTIAQNTFESALEGVCDVCSGPMEQSLDICSDHAPEGVCDTCRRRPAVIARFHCPICKTHHQAPPYLLVAQHPAVIAFYHELGVPFQYEVDDFESQRQRRHLFKAHDQTLLGEDPPRIRVRVEYEGESLAMILDEALRAIEVETSL